MTDVPEFEALRPHLLRLAYSQMGSLDEAEDVVQEAWLRLQRTDRAAIADLRGWLTTVVGRLSLDLLRSARVRREQYVATPSRTSRRSSGALRPAPASSPRARAGM
jgi:RNA polymerase sigma-70 factor (ECF subfamily)